MNKRTIIASLNKIANELDNNGLYKEANTVTKVMSRLAYDDFELGLGAVPHRRIDSPMNSSDYDNRDGDIDLSDGYEGFDKKRFEKMVEALRDLTMPYGHEEDLVAELMNDYQVDPTEPSYEGLEQVFRDLDDIIDDPRSNIYREQKVRLDGKMVDYDYLKREMLHEAGLI